MPQKTLTGDHPYRAELDRILKVLTVMQMHLEAEFHDLEETIYEISKALGKQS